MPRCCGGSGSSTVIHAGDGIVVTGIGTPSDPYLITSGVGLTTFSNQFFQVNLTGSGTLADPWEISVEYAATAKLNDIPDVDAPAPTAGQVLAYDTTSGTWKPQPPATATPGLISHDTSLSGDGSSGVPLAVRFDPARFLGGTTDGIGLSATGHQQIVRHFTDSAERDAAVPLPTLNALSMLNTPAEAVGRIDYYDGTAWQPYRPMALNIVGEFMQLSGPYSNNPVTVLVRQVSATTDANGVFTAIGAADLTGFGGVVTAQFQQTGTLAPTFTVTLNPATDHVNGTAFRGDDGLVYANQLITGTLFAYLY